MLLVGRPIDHSIETKRKHRQQEEKIRQLGGKTKFRIQESKRKSQQVELKMMALQLQEPRRNSQIIGAKKNPPLLGRNKIHHLHV